MKTLISRNLNNRAAISRWSALLLLAAGTQTLMVLPLGAATPVKEITDSGITAAVESILRFANGVSPDSLEVKTSQGIVTLSGSTDNLLAKDRAVNIAEAIRGVRSVVDRVTVKPVSRPDEDIRKGILMAVLQDPATESYQVAVSVKDSIATLISLLDRTLIPNTKNAELKSLLESGRPIFVAHLEHAKTLQASLGK